MELYILLFKHLKNKIIYIYIYIKTIYNRTLNSIKKIYRNNDV